MSLDELFLVHLLASLERVRLEYVVVGMAAASMQGVPIMTQHVDLLVRDTALNRTRIDDLAQAIGAGRPIAVSELTTTLSLVGADVPVDVLFDQLPGGGRFEGLRARAVTVPLGSQSAIVASLGDIIASKRASGRPKDLAHLHILQETQRIRELLDDTSSPSERPM